jgi:hypothetical protein
MTVHKEINNPTMAKSSSNAENQAENAKNWAKVIRAVKSEKTGLTLSAKILDSAGFWLPAPSKPQASLGSLKSPTFVDFCTLAC